MSYITHKTKAFLADESGAAALEYGLLAALIAAVIAVSVGSIGTSLNAVFTYVNSKLSVP